MYYAAHLSTTSSLIALPSPICPPSINFSFSSLSLSAFLYNWLALTGVSFFSLRAARLSAAASFVAQLPPASLSSKQALYLFSNLTAWLSLAYPFSLSSAVSKCLPSLCSNVQWTLDRILLLTPHTNYKQLHSISNMISRSLIDQLIYTQYVLCSAS